MKERKVVLITGATSDIGYSIAKKFAYHDYDIVIQYFKNKKRAETMKDELEELYHSSVLTICFDISDEKEVSFAINKVIEKYNKIDVLINGAAIEINNDIFEKRIVDFKRVLDVNLIGTFIVSRSIAKYMLEKKKGSIVNISSDNSTLKYDPYTLEYDVSKAGVNLLTKELAKAFAPYIRVNNAIVGWVNNDKNKSLDKSLDGNFISTESEKIALKRFAECEEIASSIYFLASNDSSYIDGCDLVINGG